MQKEKHTPAIDGELPENAQHRKLDHVFLYVRNVMAGVAALLFLASFVLPQIHKLLRAIAYFCGAAAYLLEILVMTDCLRKQVPRKELFMAFCFGPLYILLGLSYLLEA